MRLIARQLWDDHYAEIASGCARTVPETETVHAIVQEAFVQLAVPLGPAR